MITIEPYIASIVSGMNRFDRRKFYKSKHKKLVLGSWNDFNSHPAIWKQKPIIIHKDKSRMGYTRRKEARQHVTKTA